MTAVEFYSQISARRCCRLGNSARRFVCVRCDGARAGSHGRSGHANGNIFAKIGRKSRIKAEQPKRDLSTFSTVDLAAGADIYQKDCAFCHGLPNQSKPDAAKGMFPHAPQLLDKEDMVTDDPVGESFWKVKNGIRLSGMPGFKQTLSETQMWQVSALLAKADQLPSEVSAKLQPKSVSINTPVIQ